MPRGLKPPPKIQRWIDLLAALLARRYPVTFEELIADVPAYQGGRPEARDPPPHVRARQGRAARASASRSRRSTDERGRARAGYQLRAARLLSPVSLAPRWTAGTEAAAGRTSTATARSRPSPSSPRSWRRWPTRRRGSASWATRSSPSTPSRPCGSWPCDLPVDATRRRTRPASRPRGRRPTPELFAALGDALDGRKRVTFDYRSMGSDAVAPAHRRAVRALLPQPALVSRRPRRQARTRGQELPAQPDRRAPR